ncbi:FadR/GntR family transcriptional regulator [Desulfatirhabdium butyrativorans]|uniref:FadR/GntR family transcriptional regulator n=1 Tax=Desulfatirhabdium butyrativorans TaxID=340467 RepID=UPI00040EEE06|nr:FadR/GntR family transcriptional regulator [Desulfatirhabdium butyrativorans]
MKVSLKPIKPKRISDQVFDQLRELIFRGELKAGEQIMPERELAEALNVSRISVRDAIKKLVVMGLLEQRQGQGTFVRSPDAKSQNPLAILMETQNASLEDLLEVRMGLECYPASLAAERASASDIQFLEKSIEEMRSEVQSGRLGTEADVSFHMAIAYATKNPLQVYIMKNFFDFLFVGIKENLSYLYKVPGNIETILEQHQKIFQAIRSHDPAQSFDAMKEHIHFVLNFFRSFNIKKV